MKIKIELTTKELADLHANRDRDAGRNISIEYIADVTTESGQVSLLEEHLIFGSALWGLLVMLPHGLVKQYFLAWNKVVEDISKTIDTAIKDELASQQPTVDPDVEE